MKRKIVVFLFLIPLFIHSQKELWFTGGSGGLTTTNPMGYGGIVKTDFNGSTFEDVHLFDSSNGMKPYGRLFVASNGKLYGTASEGGLYNTEFVEGGVLFEYDLILNVFRVVAHLGSSQMPSTNRPLSGVFEPIPGILFGSSDNSAIYKYTIQSELLSISANVPNFNSGSLIINNAIRGELMKASNGFVYGTTKHFSNTPNGAPYLGSIARLNPANNVFSIVYPFVLESGPLYGPTGGLVEVSSGKLYGTTYLGGTGTYTPTDPFNLGGGTLFEYTIATNTLTKKVNFDYYTTGNGPGSLCLATNGKLYGILQGGGSQGYGSLFEYSIADNTTTIVKHFGYENSVGIGVGAKGTLLKASDSNLYGVSAVGIFKYEPTTNLFTQFSGFGISTITSPVGELLEICRKPMYHFFDVNTFDTCEGSDFTYDIQNTNATSYQWQQNGNNLINQTTGVLQLTNISTSDAGNYTCIMTNECGVTTTMPLNITVNCLGTNTTAQIEKAIKIYPNPTNAIIHIELPTNFDTTISALKIVDLLGKEVLTSQNSSNTVDVSHLSKGVYIITLQTNLGRWNGKFVKI